MYPVKFRLSDRTLESTTPPVRPNPTPLLGSAPNAGAARLRPSAMRTGSMVRFMKPPFRGTAWLSDNRPTLLPFQTDHPFPEFAAEDPRSMKDQIQEGHDLRLAVPPSA